MKFESKQVYFDMTNQQWTLLWETVERALDSENQKVKVEQVRKILAHLYAWHLLLLEWHRVGKSGQIPDLPAKNFNWRQTPKLNKQLNEQYSALSIESVCRRLKLSHRRIEKTIKEMSARQFLKPGVFKWTGKHSLSSYVAPNTLSHYRWAIKKLKQI